MERVERLSQAYSQAPWRKQLQILGLFLLLIVFIALIASIYLNVSTHSAEVGREIQWMESRILTDEQKISDLKAQLGIAYSDIEMGRRARSLGFEQVNPEEALYIAVPDYIERQPVNLAPAYQPQVVSAPTLPEEYTQSLFVWLQKQFNQIIFPLFKVRP